MALQIPVAIKKIKRRCFMYEISMKRIKGSEGDERVEYMWKRDGGFYRISDWDIFVSCLQSNGALPSEINFDGKYNGELPGHLRDDLLKRLSKTGEDRG